MNENILQIKRGTTPTIIINIPKTIDLSDINEVWFSISQDGNTENPLIKRERNTINIDYENYRIWIILTQEETLSFKPTDTKISYKQNEVTELEVSVLLTNGVRATSKRYMVTILECVREGIMLPSEIDVDEPLEDSLILDLDIGTCTNLNPMSYSDLQNKPSINNVELDGNKTSEDLGIIIPTKTSDLENDSDYTSLDDSVISNTSTWSSDKITSEIEDKAHSIGLSVTYNNGVVTVSIDA